MHEVMEEATLDDITYFIAAKNLQAQEERRASARANARAKSR